MTEKQIALIKAVIALLNERELEYFLIGATARNLLFEKKNLAGLRKTNDWDFAVQLGSWNDYQELIAALLDRGFSPTKSIHTVVHDNLMVDIVPFGGSLEDENGMIHFPEPSGNIMSISGFSDFLKMTETVDFHGISIRVGAFEALLGSKIFAWHDRKSIDDAGDIRILIANYVELSKKDFYEEIAEENFPLKENFDIENSKAYLAGQSLARSLSEISRKKVLSIVTEWLWASDPEIVRQWNKQPFSDEKFSKELSILEHFKDGLSSNWTN